MGLNSSRTLIVAERRAEVARLRLRGRTVREIVGGLAQRGLVNPADGEPWSLGTVAADIKALERQWREEAVEELATHKARQLARLEEHYREAWQAADLREVRENVKLAMALLGTEAPKKQEVRATVASSGEFDGMSDDELQRELETLTRSTAALFGRHRAGAADSAGADSEG